MLAITYIISEKGNKGSQMGHTKEILKKKKKKKKSIVWTMCIIMKYGK